MAGDELDRRAGDHLERAVDRILDEKRQLPEVTRVTVRDFDASGEIDPDHVEIDCDICEQTVAVAPGLDGWKTQDQPGPAEQPLREHIGSYVLCKPCKDAWERADYDDLYARCGIAHPVDDLAQLAGDTIRIPDPPRRDEGFGLRLVTATASTSCAYAQPISTEIRGPILGAGKQPRGSRKAAVQPWPVRSATEVNGQRGGARVGRSLILAPSLRLWCPPA
jgi:hypothetical protein